MQWDGLAHVTAGPRTRRRSWPVRMLLQGEEVSLALSWRSAKATDVVPEVRVKIQTCVIERNAYVLAYVYNGEYVELEVDSLTLEWASTEDLLSWGDDAFIG